ncbi:hypothetical protein [Paenibacillus sp. FSL R7-0179]|uniref:hypothetical protein n=1 Tax=Paenibacillus sp. FSL R7-0179 TaxID=2921672 RepID=UPI0030F912A0
MKTCNHLLVQMSQLEQDEVYLYYAKRGEVDHLIRMLIQLSERGLVSVNSKSWAWGGDEDLLPIDVVASGIYLTSAGRKEAERLIKEMALSSV